MRRLMLVCATAPAALLSGCSSSTEARFDWANITLVSGANQNVTVNPDGLTDLPQLVVVRVDSLGTPKAGAEVRATAHMSGAPGPNGSYFFFTGADGVASMQLQVSNIKGPVRLTVDYVVCTDLVFFSSCNHFRTLATVNVPGIVAQ